MITAVVTEQAGTPVADGTVVQFITNLGQVEAIGKTIDGLARVKFVSDGRSGTATITGFSGGGVAPGGSPTGTATATATGTATTTPTARPTVSLMGIAFAQSSSGATGKVTVTIGAVLVKKLILTANPQRIVFEPRQSQIVATALDGDGNPVPDTPIYFRVAEEEGNISTVSRYEWMASGGDPVFTDNNGRAYDTLYTRAGVAQDPRAIKVYAKSANGDEVSVDLQVN